MDPKKIYRRITPIPVQLIEWLENNKYHFAVPLIKERDEVGVKKYGRSLYPGDNSRDTVQDAKEEIGDLLQYLFKAKLDGKDLSEFRNYLPVLEKLLN